MSISHCWFQSGSYSILAHIENSADSASRLGVVIVPPFGWEEVCSYRPIRSLSRSMTEAGIPTLRFDLPGTGDSSGSSSDPHLFPCWIQSIHDATSALVRATGVDKVALVGVRLGAILAILATRDQSFESLVLWDAPVSGRKLLREMRLLHQLEATACPEERREAENLRDGMELAGFHISAATKSVWESFEISSIPSVRRGRVLLLHADTRRVPQQLRSVFQSKNWHVETSTGAEYAAIMNYPHESVMPAGACQAILQFLLLNHSPNHRLKDLRKTHHSSPSSPSQIVQFEGNTVIEEAHRIQSSLGWLFAMVSLPPATLPRSEYCLLLLNAGAVRHTGPNRMWVEIARRWAIRGVCSVRVDLPGVGEGEGEKPSDLADMYRDGLLREVERAMQFASSSTGAQKIIAIGLCSGAFCAFHAAVRNPEVRGAILLNPRLFFWDPEVDRRRTLRRLTNGFGNAEMWSRLVQGEISPVKIKQAAKVVLRKMKKSSTPKQRELQIPHDPLANSLNVLKRNQTKTTLIFSEGEPLLQELEEEGHLPLQPPSLFRSICVPKAGHTFHPLWAQALVHDVIDGEIRHMVELGNPVPLQFTATV